jgi:uncharacterized protein YyaL (SSP411 family)
MHHNPAKNVLYKRAPIEEIAVRLKLSPERVTELLKSAKQKMYSARLKRPTPYIDKTVYVGWNALCISAYLQAANALELHEAKRFALRSLDRILAEAWRPEIGLGHVVAYSDAHASRRDTNGFLDDYAFTAIACLDANQSTADLSYFRAAKKITDQMIDRFYDADAGGFFDSSSHSSRLGALTTSRKPFQDSPTPAGNPMAAIALIRMHSYTGEQHYREKAQRTLELLAGVAGQYELFAATYAIATVYFFQPETKVVIVGEDESANRLYREALATPHFGKSALKLTFNEAVAQNLPPSLAETIPNLPAVKDRKTSAVVCTGASCKPPVHEVAALHEILWAQEPAA